ncbi:MAG TPA: ABC transporter ATP-binding protein [Solirubrobacterales bacterium]|nr:ABC transporter ATP-binding protein [Solirubrobacterales bacterium]
MSLVAEVEGLRVEVAASGAEIVDQASFEVGEGEVVGLVGESGSGKTTTALALLGDARRGTRLAAGKVLVAGHDMRALSARQLRDVRGKVVSYVPQDPTVALNPGLRIDRQLGEVLDEHTDEAAARRRERIAQVLEEVRLPADRQFLRRYPHQLSGGQQQRVCIAMAFLLQPKLIVMDEPTTGLDVSTQAHVLRIIREMCQRHRASAVYVSHDLAVVASLAQRVVVMYAGRLVERGPAEAIFRQPAHPYTRKLIEAIPDLGEKTTLNSIPGKVPAPGERPSGCVFADRCDFAIERCREVVPDYRRLGSQDVLCIRAEELGREQRRPAPGRVPAATATAPAAALLAVEDVAASYGERRVLSGVSLELHAGECIALVGESGSGKTTLSRTVAGLHGEWSGEIKVDGTPVGTTVAERPKELCRRMQYVFQSPFNSLNPRRSVGDAVRAPLQQFFGLRGRAADERVAATLERVSLPAATMDRYPDELSGGERQRVAIARALAAEPEILICDEVTSALDTSVQAAIISLLQDLQASERLGILFVTHNIALVRTIAERVLVLSAGTVVEAGTTPAVLDMPRHPYTRSLIDDTPDLFRGDQAPPVGTAP